MPAIPSWTPQWPHGLTKNGSSCPCCQPGVMDRRSWSRRQQDQALLDAQYEQLRDLYPQRSPPLNRIQSPPHQQETFHFEGGQDNEHEHTEDGEEGKHLSIEGRGDGDGDSSDGSSDKDGYDDERGRDKEEQDRQSAQDGDDEQEDEEDEEDEDEDEDEEEDDEDDDDEDDEEDEDEDDEDEDDEDDEDGGDGKDDTDGDDIVKKEPEEFHIGNNSAPAAFTQQPPPQLPSYRHEEDNVVVKLEPEDTDVDSDMFLLDGDDEFVKSDSHQPSGLPPTAALHGLDASHIPMTYGQMPPAAAAEAAPQQQQQQWLNPWPRSRPRRRSRANTSAPQPRPTVVSSGLAARNAHLRNAHLRTQPPPLQPHTPHATRATRATRPPRLPQLRVDAVVQADPSDPSTAQTPAGMDAFWDAALQRLRYEKQQQQLQEQREQREQQLQLQQQLQEQQQQQLLHLHLQEQQEQKLMQLQQMQQLQLLQQQQLPLPLPTPTTQKLPQPFAPLQPGWRLPWAPATQSFDMALPQRYPDPLPLQSAMPRVIISPPAYLVAFADGTVVEASRYQHEARTHGIETARDRLRRFRSREPALSGCRGPPASRCNISSYACARRGRTCVDIISADPDSDGPRLPGAPHKRPCPCCNMYIRRKRTAMPAVDYWREKTRGDCIPISVLYDMLPRPPNPFADDY